MKERSRKQRRRELLRLIASQAAEIVAWRARVTIYVSPGGSDATGERGNPGKPFRTLEQAVRFVQDGDVFHIAPPLGPMDFLWCAEDVVGADGMPRAEWVDRGPNAVVMRRTGAKETG